MTEDQANPGDQKSQRRWLWNVDDFRWQMVIETKQKKRTVSTSWKASPLRASPQPGQFVGLFEAFVLRQFSIKALAYVLGPSVICPKKNVDLWVIAVDPQRWRYNPARFDFEIVADDSPLSLGLIENVPLHQIVYLDRESNRHAFFETHYPLPSDWLSTILINYQRKRKQFLSERRKNAKKSKNQSMVHS